MARLTGLRRLYNDSSLGSRLACGRLWAHGQGVSIVQRGYSRSYVQHSRRFHCERVMDCCL